MKRLINILVCALLMASFAEAQTVTDDLVGLGMHPELAEFIATRIPGGVNLDNNAFFKSTDAAGTGTLSMLKGDATDDTVLNADSGDMIKFSVANTPVAAIGAATPVAAFTPQAVGNLVSGGSIQGTSFISSGAFTGAGLMVGTPVSGVTPAAGVISVGGQANFASKINSTSYLQAQGALYGTPKAGITPNAGNVAVGGTLDVVGASTLGAVSLTSVSSDIPLAAGKQVQQAVAIITPSTNMTPAAASNLASPINRLVAGSPTLAAVHLPAATPNKGKTFFISNEGSNPVLVFPGGTDKINAGGAATPVSVAAGKLERCIVTQNDRSLCFPEN